MRFGFIGWHHWRWALWPPASFRRIDSCGAHHYARVLFWDAIKYAPCTCKPPREPRPR